MKRTCTFFCSGSFLLLANQIAAQIISSLAKITTSTGTLAWHLIRNKNFETGALTVNNWYQWTKTATKFSLRRFFVNNKKGFDNFIQINDDEKGYSCDEFGLRFFLLL